MIERDDWTLMSSNGRSAAMMVDLLRQVVVDSDNVVADFSVGGYHGPDFQLRFENARRVKRVSYKSPRKSDCFDACWGSYSFVIDGVLSTSNGVQGVVPLVVLADSIELAATAWTAFGLNPDESLNPNIEMRFLMHGQSPVRLNIDGPNGPIIQGFHADMDLRPST